MSFYDGVKLKGEILVSSVVWRAPSASNAHVITCLLLQIKCFHKKQHSNNMELIFRVQFHTSFVKDDEMVFAKDELDEAHRGVCCLSAGVRTSACPLHVATISTPNRQAFPRQC